MADFELYSEVILKKSLFVLALATTSCFAIDDEDPCNVEGGGVMAGALCVEGKIKIAEKALNQTFQEAITRIREEEAALQEIELQAELENPFLTAQKVWFEYRDAECEFYGLTSTPFPWQGVHIEECKLEMTLERVEYFKSIYPVPD